MKEEGGVECLWSDLSEHPQCPHGPTLLFARSGDGNLEKFYACSACRNRKQCNFYMQHGQKQKDTQRKFWAQEKKKVMPNCNHRLSYIRFNEALAKSSVHRNYCNNCGKLVFTHELDKHKDHDVIENLSDYQMYHPTELLKPLSNPQKEAQYLFSKKSTRDIVDILLNVGAKQVLCIGTPRVHEYIIENCEFKMSTLLLDFDRRYHNFFGPLSFCWYNLFNHHFFGEEGQSVFKEFMTQNAGKHTYLLCDPPFGGRAEAISQTIKTISDLHKKWNKIENDEDRLRIVFVFPYFMEGILKKRSTPPSIVGGLKDLKMTDYKVDYDNHELYVNTSERKVGSPVRIFTNVPLNLLRLPEEDGYKYCKRCQRWVSKENKHCKICKQCTSKDGKRYRHCTLCNRCVKPTWKHCDVCQKCAIGTHICGQKPKIIGCCLKCNEHGHTEQDCEAEATNENIKIKKSKKRKASGEYTNSTMEDETSPKQKINTKETKIKSKGIKKPKLPKSENSEDCVTSKESDGHAEQDCKTEVSNENIKIKKSKKHKANGEYTNSTMKNETSPKEKINTKETKIKSKGTKKPKLARLENSEDCGTSKESDGLTEQDCKTEVTNENIKIKKSKKRKADGEYINSTMKNETSPKEKTNTKETKTKSKGTKKPKLPKLQNSEDCTTSKKSDELKSTDGRKSVTKQQTPSTKSKVTKFIKKKKRNEKQIL